MLSWGDRCAVSETPRNLVAAEDCTADQPGCLLMQDLVFLKLGGSILTDKQRPEALDEAALERVVSAIAAMRREAAMPRLLIGHGAGSFGHYWANLYGTHLGAHDARGWEGVVRVADAMRRLNGEVVQRLLQSGVEAVAIQPSASAVTEQGMLTTMAVEPLRALLDADLVPVVHGDVAVDRVQGVAIISTEAVFAFLAERLRPRRIILVGEDAVYNADPRRDPNAMRIPVIDDSNIAQVLQQTSGSHGIDVTGGMAAKVATMWRLVRAVDGLEVRVVGVDAQAIGEAMRGDQPTVGTVIRRDSPDKSQVSD